MEGRKEREMEKDREWEGGKGEKMEREGGLYPHLKRKSGCTTAVEAFLPRDATQSAVMPQYIVCPSVTFIGTVITSVGILRK